MRCMLVRRNKMEMRAKVRSDKFWMFSKRTMRNLESNLFGKLGHGGDGCEGEELKIEAKVY